MSSKNKKYVYVGGGIVLLYLLYRYYKYRQAQQATATGGIQGPSGAPAATTADFAAVQGQEQADVAALQQQNTQLMAQEQSDVQALQASNQSLTDSLAASLKRIKTLTKDIHILQVAPQQTAANQQTTASPAPAIGNVNQIPAVAMGAAPPPAVSFSSWLASAGGLIYDPAKYATAVASGEQFYGESAAQWNASYNNAYNYAWRIAHIRPGAIGPSPTTISA